MASAVFILDQKGKPLIWRNYRGDIPSNVPERFMALVEDQEESSRKPVIESDGLSYVYVHHQNLWMLVVAKQNANAAMLLVFLYRLLRLFKDYFDEVEEESVRDNFVIIYELLDEIMEFGYPQITDGRVLQQYIFTGSNRLDTDGEQQILLPSAVTGAVGWRPQGIVHKKNEVFLDVIESVHMVIATNGSVLRSEIQGTVHMNVLLTGMPELKLGLNDRLQLQGRATRGRTVELEDVKFHQCVRLGRFEADRQINFVPPDGEFDLMSYRMEAKVKPLFLVDVAVESHAHSRVEYTIRARSQFKARSSANNVQIEIPVSPDVSAPFFKAAIGNVSYVPERDVMVWTIKQFSGGKEYQMRAHFALPSIQASEAERKAPVRVKFDIPYFTVSGIQVKYLKIVEHSGYTALPWVRYITRSGDYQIRWA